MRTIFYEVAELNNPADEPFMVVRIDVAARRGNGVEGVVQSLHRTREEASARAKELTEEGRPCGRDQISKVKPKVRKDGKRGR